MSNFLPYLPKFLAALVEQRKWPVVIVQKAKHENPYYLCHSPEDFLKACIQMLKYNYDSGCYGRPERPAAEALTQEQALALPEPYRSTEIKRQKVAARDLARYEDDLDFWNHLQLALKGDGILAYQLVVSHEDHEYEGFDIVKPWEAAK